MTLIDDLPLGADASDMDTHEPGGEFITDELGVKYWLTSEQVEEYDAADSDIDNDDEFNDWFREFVFRHDIKPVKQRRGRGWSDLWKPITSHAPKYLSEWSLSPVYRASATDNQAVYLAEMLGGVQSIVRALEPLGVRYRVVLSSDSEDAPNSYTSYSERLISVSPQPLLDKSLERGEAIDITSGEGLHEVSHVRDSEPIYAALLARPGGPPMPWAIGSFLLNLIEDVRIERNTSREYPGFAGYFDRMNAYLWKLQEAAGVAPTAWGPKLADKLNAAVLIVKWPTEYEPIAKAKPRSHLAREFGWWRDWLARYLAGADAYDIVAEGLAHLGEDPAVKSELDSIEERERMIERATYDLREAARKAFEEWAKKLRKQLADPCPTPGRSKGRPGSPSKLSERIGGELKAEVEGLLDEEMMIDKPGISTSDGDAHLPKVVILKPKRGYDAMEPVNRSTLSRMRDAFKFRHVDNDEVTRMLRSGRLDKTQLYRWKNHDFRIFDRRLIKSKPSTHVTLLIDQSGSMGNTKLRSAVNAAQVVHACLKDMAGVTLRVRSHTADAATKDGGSGNVVIYRIWEKGEPMDQLTSVFKLPHINNGDGYAIEWCANELLQSSRPHEQRLLIVFSDGQPAFSGYDRRSGIEHVRQVVSKFEKQGVTVVQIAIDSALTAESQARMFTNWIPFSGLDRLPLQVTNLLKRLL